MKAVALLAIPPFREVVLAQHDVAGAGLHLDAADAAPFFPVLAHDEPQDIAVPGDALVQVVHGERRGHGAEAQRLGLLALGPRRRALPAGTRSLLFLRGHRRVSSLSRATRAPSVASPRRVGQNSQ